MMRSRDKKLLIILITIISLLLTCSISIRYCGPRWYTVSSVYNEDYHVVARIKETDATTPVAIGIYKLTSGQEHKGQEELIKLIHWYQMAHLSIDENNILLAITCDLSGGVPRNYYFLDLDYQCDKLTYWSKDKLINDSLIVNYRIDHIIVEAHRIRDYSYLSKINFHNYDTDFDEDLYILCADSVSIYMVEKAKFGLDIYWSSGKLTDNLFIELPDDKYDTIIVTNDLEYDSKGLQE